MNCPHGLDPFAGDGCATCFGLARISSPRTMAAYAELVPMVTLEQRRAFGRVLVTLAAEFLEMQERALALRVRMLAAQIAAKNPLDYLNAPPAAAARKKHAR